ncbi:HEXXH motif domain-containing protein [Nocardia panacis]|uniref:HEXXH motif domain-containing protein n=1 Tax=Nocardia panacis TaxID=2340916 RepID=UPI0013157F21|nr:HEXXH motif domain-containing protein [Nocardia panacis]
MNGVHIDSVTADLSTGFGSSEAIADLFDEVVLTRMILLRLLMSEIAPEIADAAGLPAAYRRLAELQREYPRQVRAMLSHPHTGTWLTRTIRRVRGTDSATMPLWVECGYLGWLAAACAVMCESAGELAVVVRAGAVVLPGIGLARLGAVDGHARLEWSGGALTFTMDDVVVRVRALDAEDESGWLPMRKVRADIVLDDLDPLRDLQQDEAPRLTAAEAETWRETFADAWDLLGRDFAGYRQPMHEALRMLAPLSARPRTDAASHTATAGGGCVYTTAPADPCQLALTLIHEVQHTKLNLLLDRVDLVEFDPGPLFYAPWRDDPRPLPGLLHGIYAFFGVTDFWRVHRHSDCHGGPAAHIDFVLWRGQVAEAIEQAAGSRALTAAGLTLVRTLAAAMEPWLLEDVPAVARSTAAEVVRAHRTFWRVRNLRPDAGDIAELARRWRAGERRPELPAVSRPVDQDAIPAGYRTLALAHALRDRSMAVSGGDREYLAGRHEQAMVSYLASLREDPSRPQVWAGMALVLPQLFRDRDFEVLHTRSEIVAALYAVLRADDVDILDLLRWLAEPRDH